MKNLFLLSILPLAICMTACKDKTPKDNPFLSEWNTPFGVPPFDQIKTEHYLPAFEEGMTRRLAEIDAIVANADAPTFDNTILALDNSGEMLFRVSSVFFMLCAADTNDQMQKIQEDIAPRLASNSDQVMLNEGLFNKVKAVYDQRENLNLDAMQLRLTDKIYTDFVRAGALLPATEKERLKQINQQLSSLTFKFGSNLLESNKNFELVLEQSDIEGLPEGVISAAADCAKAKGHEGKYVFTLEKPSWIPFLTYSPRRDLREKLYNGYLTRCNHGDSIDNKPLIDEMVSLRYQKAKMLGFETYADFVLDNQMAKTPANVYELLDALWTPALAGSKRELAEMKKLMAADGLDPDQFNASDWWYYAEKVRNAKYSLDEEAVRPYLVLDNVRQGAFDVATHLYGITFRPIQVPVYHEECTAYEVLDKDGSHLNVLYLDFHPRAGHKSGGAWFDEFSPLSYKDGKKIASVSSIVCNFTRPAGDKPALLSLDEAETFFHEFGHALHHMFIDVPYRGLHGVERDFVELPSQIMENWAFEPQVLRQYAKHYQTGEVIPDELIEKMQKSSRFNQGFVNTEFLAAALSDMEIHSRPTADKIADINAFERQVLNEKRGLIPQIAPRYHYTYFSHIFDGGYAVGYYGYKWAEVLDKDAYQAFVETGDIFNPEMAAKFRNEVLSKGGSADGMTLYVNFRGKQPSREPLLRARGLI